MKPERYSKVEELYHATLEREPNERASFLEQACGEDVALRSEVESLLGYDARAEHFIERPPDDVAAAMLAAEQKQSMLGNTLGHYRIVSLLGAGGMGEVYLAEDTRLKRKVALKLLPAHFTADRDRARRFEQEARAASALNHPNIITIHEIGEIGETHYLVTEFIDGEMLRARLSTGRMELPSALEVTLQVASALAAAHEAGIVHRDIKPENIMLRRDGYVKVLDFGLAKLTEPPSARHRCSRADGDEVNTETGVVMGTARYMSPEQARGQKVDARSDIFSLGIVLYEMITGRVPFEGATASDVIAAILDKEPSPLARYAPEVPVELERIVAKAMRKDREERYQTIKDLHVDLKGLKQELEAGAKDADRGQRRRHCNPPGVERRVSRQRDKTSQAGSFACPGIPGHQATSIVYFTSGGKPIDSVAVLPFVNAKPIRIRNTSPTASPKASSTASRSCRS